MSNPDHVSHLMGLALEWSQNPAKINLGAAISVYLDRAEQRGREDNKDLQIRALKTSMLKIADWTEGRKLDKGSCLTDHATGGFNLACDFLANELRKMAELDNQELLE